MENKHARTDRLMQIIVEANKGAAALSELVNTLGSSTDFLEASIGREARCTRDSLLTLVTLTRQTIKQERLLND